jgi:hypothetical protein
MRTIRREEEKLRIVRAFNALVAGRRDVGVEVVQQDNRLVV